MGGYRATRVEKQKECNRFSKGLFGNIIATTYLNQDFSFCWNDGIEYFALIDRLALSRQLYEVQIHFYMVFSVFRQYQVVYARFKIFKNNGRY